jgi:hypothetical protein
LSPAANRNIFEIEACGPQIRFVLSEILVTNYTADDNRPPPGRIGLEDRTLKVQFRNIMIRYWQMRGMDGMKYAPN